MEKTHFNLNVPLPNDLNLERALIGKIMFNNNILSDVLTKVNMSDFYADNHKYIFNAMGMLHGEASIDSVTIAHFLGADLPKVSLSYLAELQGSEATSQGYEYLCEKIRELSSRRETIKELVATAERIIDTKSDMEENTQRIASIADNTLKSVNKGDHSLNMQKLIAKTEAEVWESLKYQGQYKGRSSGISDLDEAIGGFEDELIVVGARPSMGKTTLTVNILRGLSQNHKCLFFSMEQKDTQLITKMIAQDTKIDSRRIDRGDLNGQEQEIVFKSMKRLKDLQLSIDERAGVGIAEIESAIVRAKQTKGLDVACIDYLQYMDIGKTDNSNAAFTRVVKSLKTLTKKYKICIILLSQLSRACESRNDKRPIMSDLRDSGSIEQEADKILLLYRDVYYNKDTELKDILEINVAKYRNGQTNPQLQLGFDLNKQLIYSLTREDKVRAKQGKATEDKDKYTQMAIVSDEYNPFENL